VEASHSSLSLSTVISLTARNALLNSFQRHKSSSACVCVNLRIQFIKRAPLSLSLFLLPTLRTPQTLTHVFTCRKGGKEAFKESGAKQMKNSRKKDEIPRITPSRFIDPQKEGAQKREREREST
jgi:hypothetical protein